MDKLKVSSLDLKIISSLIFVGFFLIIIFFVLIAPNHKAEKKDLLYAKFNNVLYLVTEQSKMAVKSLSQVIDREIHFARVRVENELRILSLENLTDEKLNKVAHLINCKINKSINMEGIALNTWYATKPLSQYKNIYDNQYISYSVKTKTNHYLTATCNQDDFPTNHSMFEENIKINLQNSFSSISNLHKGKIFLMSLNKNWSNNKERNFIDKDADKYYWISHLSNISDPNIVNLKPYDIIEVLRSKTSKHYTVNNKEYVTWVRLIKEDSERVFILVASALKKDLEKDLYSHTYQLIPSILIALIIALCIGFFIFKRVLIHINKLANTAKEVNKGNYSLRSNIKGKDDIGILGIAFDTMLDSLEKNIKELDDKVDVRTSELKSSLEEKEMLLREIHHRVKNNLALSIGFIQLQQSKIQDRKTKKILQNIQDRIFTMELLHRKLYESTNLNSIPMKSYICSLVKDISSSYDMEKRVKLVFDIEEHCLNIEEAMPCGLIINEIVTNAFKYAYTKENSDPNLCIRFYKKEQYILEIKDNGIGFNKNITHSHETLGLKLINSIVKVQLKGELNFNYDQGTSCVIKFNTK